VDRRARGGIVERVVVALGAAQRLCLVVTPEGTRKKVRAWKAGFYRIAHGAGVPILPVAFDYRKRAVVFHAPLQPSGDYEADLAALRGLYDAAMAYHPGNY
jgi:1-acyl-sn-glycerol-3-phosphate acyltransferase